MNCHGRGGAWPLPSFGALTCRDRIGVVFGMALPLFVLLFLVFLWPA
jgi:hypothetical protein